MYVYIYIYTYSLTDNPGWHVGTDLESIIQGTNREPRVNQTSCNRTRCIENNTTQTQVSKQNTTGSHGLQWFASKLADGAPYK